MSELFEGRDTLPGGRVWPEPGRCEAKGRRTSDKSSYVNLQVLLNAGLTRFTHDGGRYQRSGGRCPART